MSPTSDNLLTGGYIYNTEIVKRLQPQNILTYYQVDDQTELSFLDEAHTVIGDSLFIEHPALFYRIWDTAFNSRFIGLLHFLPSLDPFLHARERDEIRDRELRFLSGMDGYITTSTFIKTTLTEWGIPEERIAVCPPGLDSRFIASDDIPPDKRGGDTASRETILLTVANITRSKNLLWLLRILESFTEEAWQWRIAGSCREELPYCKRFLQAAHASPVKERITILGSLERDQILEEMRSADLFLFPSAIESYGMACLEAVATGLPVIANDTGDLGEFVVHGKNGYLLPSFDWQQWQEALTAFLCKNRKGDVSSAPQPRSWDDTAECFKQEVLSYVGEK